MLDEEGHEIVNINPLPLHPSRRPKSHSQVFTRISNSLPIRVINGNKTMFQGSQNRPRRPSFHGNSRHPRSLSRQSSIGNSNNVHNNNNYLPSVQEGAKNQKSVPEWLKRNNLGESVSSVKSMVNRHDIWDHGYHPLAVSANNTFSLERDEDIFSRDIDVLDLKLSNHSKTGKQGMEIVRRRRTQKLISTGEIIEAIIPANAEFKDPLFLRY